MKPVDLAADVLATSRVTRLVVDDAILDDFRNWVYERFPPDENKLGYLFTCKACASVWAGGLVASGLLPRKIRYTLALSELAILAHRLLEQDD